MNQKQMAVSQAIKKAYLIVLHPSALLLGRLPKLDRRFAFNREVLAHIKKIKFDKKEILAKRKERRERKFYFTNIFENAIVKDYLTNRHKIKSIESDRLVFHDRNHWAKSQKDLKILTILNRHFTK